MEGEASGANSGYQAGIAAGREFAFDTKLTLAGRYEMSAYDPKRMSPYASSRSSSGSRTIVLSR